MFGVLCNVYGVLSNVEVDMDAGQQTDEESSAGSQETILDCGDSKHECVDSWKSPAEGIMWSWYRKDEQEKEIVKHCFICKKVMHLGMKGNGEVHKCVRASHGCTSECHKECFAGRFGDELGRTGRGRSKHKPKFHDEESDEILNRTAV